MTFQFTRETKQADEFKYDKECHVILGKSDGRISCPDATLAAQAQVLLDECVVMRTSTDLGQIVQRFFTGQAHLVPVRKQGGAYIVPGDKAEFLDRVQGFIKTLGGEMPRYPIMAGTEAGDKSIQESMKAWIKGFIADHKRAIEAFDGDTRHATMERRVEKIRETKFTVEANAEYLKDLADGLLAELGQLQEELVKKVEAMAESDEKEALAAPRPPADRAESFQEVRPEAKEENFSDYLSGLRAQMDQLLAS